MCRLQEGLLQQHSIEGLLCIQCGINFVIYAALTYGDPLGELTLHISQRGFQQPRKGVFHSPRTHPRGLHKSLATARHAEADRWRVWGRQIHTHTTYIRQRQDLNDTRQGKASGRSTCIPGLQATFHVFSPLPTGQPNPGSEPNAIRWTAFQGCEIRQRKKKDLYE